MFATAPTLSNSRIVSNDHPLFERYIRMLTDIDQRLGAGAGYSVGRLHHTIGDDLCLIAELPGGLKCAIRNDLTPDDIAMLQASAAKKPQLKLKAVQHPHEPLRQKHGRELGHSTLTQCKLQMQATTIKEVAKLYGFTFVASETEVLGFVTHPSPMSLHLEPVDTAGYHLQLV